jgi:legumain
MKFASVVLAALCVVPAVLAANWGLLIAGSDMYSNYRHQADIGHAYRILRNGGIPAERIVVMAENDVPKSSSNPFPGEMYNWPTTSADDNVWDGITVDYQNGQVTAKNFLAVLAGNSTATNGRKVIASGPEDNIFVFYSDHGAPGIVAMPTGPSLQVGELRETLEGMAAAKKFDKLVFYLEACESGSMFEGWLGDDLGIYATTAANGEESSWGFYCPPEDGVRGKKINSCLGDEYSITWMESVDHKGGYDQTLQENFEYVKATVVGSHVQQFGDLSFSKLPLSAFIAEQGHKTPKPTPKSFEAELAAMSTKKINSRDINMHYLFNQYTDASLSEEERFEFGMDLVKELQSRLTADMRFRQLSNSILGAKNAVAAATQQVRPAIECGKCCEAAYNYLSADTDCKFTDYSLKYGRVIQSVCMMDNEENVDRTALVLSKLRAVCSKSLF